MPIPGLTDIYAFGDWLKLEYRGEKRKTLLIQPLVGGLIRVIEWPKEEHDGDTASSAD